MTHNPEDRRLPLVHSPLRPRAVDRPGISTRSLALWAACLFTLTAIAVAKYFLGLS